MTESTDNHSDKVNSFKKFFQKFKENWLWVNIGGIIANSLFLWILYYYEINNLGFTIGFMLFYPLMIILVVLIRKVKNPQLIYKIVFIGCFGYIGGLIFWLIFSYTLINASWAPFSDIIMGKSRLWFHIISLFVFSVLAMYILYLIGKKKGWKYQPLV
ncbi:MAG: hypothetical protein JW776_02340 [Candidatus Lokiarchaeota archaeon]|nr:hypothetical protein [Candidatus Lokiarchaeota archaeon]